MKLTTFSKSVLSVFIAVFSLSVSAQKNETKPLSEQVGADLNKTPNMALGLQKERHIKGGLRFFDQLLASETDFKNFEIVIWGNEVEKLKKGSDLASLIEENQHPKLRVSVCQVAMKRMGVSEEDLPEGVVSVPNAFLRLLQIQAKGYNVIIP